MKIFHKYCIIIFLNVKKTKTKQRFFKLMNFVRVLFCFVKNVDLKIYEKQIMNLSTFSYKISIKSWINIKFLKSFEHFLDMNIELGFCASPINFNIQPFHFPPHALFFGQFCCSFVKVAFWKIIYQSHFCVKILIYIITLRGLAKSSSHKRLLSTNTVITQSKIVNIYLKF